MRIDTLVRSRRQEILERAARHGARRVRVFVSVARSEAAPDSDVDFLVDMKPGRSLFDLGWLLKDLQDLLGCRVDLGIPQVGWALDRERRATYDGRQEVNHDESD